MKHRPGFLVLLAVSAVVTACGDGSTTGPSGDGAASVPNVAGVYTYESEAMLMTCSDGTTVPLPAATDQLTIMRRSRAGRASAIPRRVRARARVGRHDHDVALLGDPFRAVRGLDRHPDGLRHLVAELLAGDLVSATGDDANEQVEQDLVLSRALVEMFDDTELASHVAPRVEPRSTNRISPQPGATPRT